MEILLIRHGKPTAASNPKLTAAGFANWVRHYNHSKIDIASLPPPSLKALVKDHFIIASTLNRAIDSAMVCVQREPDLTTKELREMAIPRFKIPFILSANTWLMLSRFFWFIGFHGKVESFPEAKIRAQASAEYLIILAEQHEKIAVFGHGLMNQYVAKELVKQGWRRNSNGNNYWSSISLKR